MKQFCINPFPRPAAAFFVSLAVLVIAVFIASCKSEDSNPPYVAVTSGAFTFDDQTDLNTVTVEANTDWQVCWTPDIAGVVVTPASGSGDGSFVVEDMPKGAMLRFSVCHGEGENRIMSNSVSVARGTDGTGLFLTLDPMTLEFSSVSPLANVIKVMTNAAWTATPSNAALKVSPASGTGSADITVTDIPAGQSYTLTVTVGTGEDAISRMATVSRPGSGQEARILYYNNFDKTPATQSFGDNGASWPYLNQSDCWQNASEAAAPAATYTYSTAGISARNNSNSTGYTGASGVNNIFFGAPVTGGIYLGRFFGIKDITIPSDMTPLGFDLSFGTRNASGVINVYVSGDGSRWVRVPVEIASDSNWKLADTKFALSRSISKISLMFEAAVAPSSFGTRIDDVKLTTTTSTPSLQIDISTVPTTRWAELPAAVTKPNFKVFTDFSTTVVTGQQVRNYTVGYDTDLHCPLWVAYPQHYCYEEGGLTRPDVDPWAKDPNMTDVEQSYVYDGYSWVTSSYLGGGPVRWGRGHMLASSYRGCGDAANPAELNKQTFYMGNVAPQGGVAFDILWSIAGNNILNKCVCADTLYCVSGAWFENTNVMAKDKSSLSDGVVTNAPGAKDCGVPTNFYKVLLRTKGGNTGKAIQQCTASELQAVAFWFTRADKDPVSNSEAPTQVTEAYLMSVKALGDKVGFDFFPDIPASVKASYSAGDWGLPYNVQEEK